ncbi:MAG: HAMP domain-containing protein [Xanthomonadales bacterium]|nr:HAMP domain-containing protein [Xanthomonadales bacterium]
MPRLFWKLFLALWLSIMAFAVVVSWINQSVILQNAIEGSGLGFEDNQKRFKDRLERDMAEGGEQRVKRTMRNLPRGMRNHIFILDADGNELLGRGQTVKKLRQDRVRVSRNQIEAANGKTYTLISSGRKPRPGLLQPGPRGVGMRLLVAAVISALVSLLLARYLAAPLGQLSHASRILATGDLSARVGAPLVDRNDEFGQLAMDMDQMADQLQVSQQANQRLLRDVSHELRSPLARLRVALEIARNKDQNLVAEELNRIELESERLEKLVDEVLGLLRETTAPQELNKQHFDLAELLQDLVETANYEIGDDGRVIELEVQSPLEIDADRDLLWRVFENLLRNALIHGGTNGVIHVSATPSSGDKIRISVKDAGPCIAEQHLARIFEPFYRVDEARARSGAGQSTGHGLGLAIAASVVRRHGGRITASNRKGGGLNVEVVLPG